LAASLCWRALASRLPATPIIRSARASHLQVSWSAQRTCVGTDRNVRACPRNLVPQRITCHIGNGKRSLSTTPFVCRSCSLRRGTRADRTSMVAFIDLGSRRWARRPQDDVRAEGETTHKTAGGAPSNRSHPGSSCDERIMMRLGYVSRIPYRITNP
jgi:hypothetical protein